MSTPQDRTSAPSSELTPDPLPPNTKIIECACSQADSRAEDNSQWTNTIKEPFTVKKGSEIRIMSTFIDSRGVDSDVIQLQSDGVNQDNSHTMLNQMYITNDGFNNKTTSYDYMSIQDSPITILDPGQDYTGSSPITLSSINDSSRDRFGASPSGFAPQANIKSFGIRPKNISITNGGSKYLPKSTFTIASTDYAGFINVDDVGKIVSIVFTTNVSGSSMGGTNPTLVFDGYNPGSGVALNLTETTNGLEFHAINASRTNAARGTGYSQGDLILLQASSPVTDDKRAQARINNVYVGEGQVNDQAYMDQGYNYENAPLFRWTNTYETTTKFCHGNNLGPRTFESHGKIVSVSEQSSNHVDDVCLSAGFLLDHKEDHFAPGVFHTSEINKGEKFTIYKPIIKFEKTAEQPYLAFTLSADPTTDRWNLVVPNYNKIVNGESQVSNVLNTIPIGATYQLFFEYANIAAPTRAQGKDLYVNFSREWAMPMRIHSRTADATNTTIALGSSIQDYVGRLHRFVHTNLDNNHPTSSTFTKTLEFVQAEDGGNAPSVLPALELTTNSSGTITHTTITQAGVGCRPGMLFRIDSTHTDRFYVRMIDDTGGWQLPASRNATLQNSGLTYSSNDVRMYLIPVLNYSDTTYTADQIGNRIGFRKVTDASTDIFPLKLDANYLNQTAPVNSEGVSVNLANGLYRKSGQLDPNDPFFIPRESSVCNHDSDMLMDIDDDHKDILDLSGITFGDTSSGTPDVIHNFSTTTENWMFNGTDYVLRINETAWNSSVNQSFPTFTTISFISGSTEIMCELGGICAINGAEMDIQVLAYDIQNTSSTYKRIQGSIAGVIGQTFLTPNFENADNFNGNGGFTSLRIVYAKVKENNNKIDLRWQDTKGNIAVTGQHNYFGNNDLNKPSDIENNIQNGMRSSYDEGGYYFLTKFSGSLNATKSTATHPTVFNSLSNLFNHGKDFWGVADLPEECYNWITGYVQQNNDNLVQSFTDLPRLHDYQPLYRQKTFIIDKSFSVPSDISGIWTRQAHDLSGALNPLTGGEYVDRDNNGLLQNDFLMPVYGSNNQIGPNGQYIKDNDLYLDYQGLEPGHVVGKSYCQQTASWLAGSLKYMLPTESVDGAERSFYYIFFRTAYTHYRGYDPLKTQLVGSDRLPDRTALTTVNETADKIGNANDVGSTTKKSLAGDTMLAKVSSGTQPSAFELGLAGGNSSDVTFSSRSYYPIFYLDETKKSDFPKAKVSQFVGTQNVVLSFDTAVSNFAFEFLHSPFTSAFVDGQGGANSIRIFFGNRKEGVFNHESLSGVVVQNYCRPDYISGVFTKKEIDNNSTFDAFPNGIDPFTSAGVVGNKFLSRLGFTDADLGLKNGKIISGNTKLSYALTPYTQTLSSSDLDGNTGSHVFTVNGFSQFFYGTTGSDFDVSDAIIANTPSAETTAGLEENTKIFTMAVGQSVQIIQKFGSMIFYPYGLDNATNSFKDSSIVRFDNCTNVNGTTGGMLLSNSEKGLGLPNTTGSTFITDGTTIPRTLNPDCNLYLSYTVQCGSSNKQASLLPQKLTNAYLIVLSSLMKETNLYMSSAGFVNGMSIANKVFLTGDFILSNGQMSFYAKEDFILSEITTSLKDTSYNSPSTLGVNSSVIYSITDYQPTPERALPTIEEEQDVDIQLMEQVQEHLGYLQGHSKDSRINTLSRDLYQLGFDVLTQQSPDIIGSIRNQIEAYDLPRLGPNERQRFLQSPEGKNFVSNVADLQIIEQQIGRMAQIKNDSDQGMVPRSMVRATLQRARDLIAQSKGNIVQRSGAPSFPIKPRTPSPTPQTPPPLSPVTPQAPERIGIPPLPPTPQLAPPPADQFASMPNIITPRNIPQVVLDSIPQEPGGIQPFALTSEDLDQLQQNLPEGATVNLYAPARFTSPIREYRGIEFRSSEELRDAQRRMEPLTKRLKDLRKQVRSERPEGASRRGAATREEVAKVRERGGKEIEEEQKKLVEEYRSRQDLIHGNVTRQARDSPEILPTPLRTSPVESPREEQQQEAEIQRDFPLPMSPEVTPRFPEKPPKQ